LVLAGVHQHPTQPVVHDRNALLFRIMNWLERGVDQIETKERNIERFAG
jgi:hypothetical protein